MSKSISRNYIYNLSYQIITLLTPLITTPYVSRVLGPDGIGIYSYTTSVVTYFVILGTMGLSNYGQREIAYHQDDKHEQSRIFYEVCLFRLFSVFISLTAYYWFVLRNVETNYLIFTIQAINIFALIFDVAWFFQGLEEFGKVVFRNLVVRVISIICLFLLIDNHDDLWLYVCMNSLLVLFGGLLVCFYLPKYLELVSWREIKIFRNWKIVMQLFIPQIAIQIYTVLDKTMIGILTGIEAENGYYEQAEKIVKICLMVVTSLGPVMMPRIAAAYAKKQYNDIKKYLIRSYRFVWLIGLPMLFGLIASIDMVVPWFFGPGFDKVIPLVCIFSGLLLAIGINNVTGVQYLISTNKQNLFTYTVVIGAGVNFILNWLLIPAYMSIGAAIASVSAETAIALVQLWFVRDICSFLDVMKSSRNYIIGSIFMFLIMLLVKDVLEMYASIISVVVLFLVGVFSYVTVLCFTKDEFFRQMADKLIRKVRAKL